MRRLFILLLSLSLPCFIFAGCTGSVSRPINVNYYALEYDRPEIFSVDPLPVILRIDRFQISPLYDTEKLVFRDEEFHRNHYNYRRWRANPRDLITYYLSRDFLSSGRFEAVYLPDNLQRASHLLTGTVDEFYQKEDEPWKAVLTLNIVLLELNQPDISRRIIHQKTYHREFPCDEKTSDSFVRAMSNAMSLISAEIIDDVYTGIQKKGGYNLQNTIQ